MVSAACCRRRSALASAGPGGGLVQPRLGRRLLPDQLRLAPLLDRGEVRRRLRARDRGVHVLDLGLIGRLLDDEQEVARLDVLAFGEQPLLEEPLDPGAQVHLVHGLDAAGETGRGRNVARLDLHHGDRRCPRKGLLRRSRTGGKGNLRHSEAGRRCAQPDRWCLAHANLPSGWRRSSGLGGVEIGRDLAGEAFDQILIFRAALLAHCRRGISPPPKSTLRLSEVRAEQPKPSRRGQQAPPPRAAGPGTVARRRADPHPYGNPLFAECGLETPERS